MKFQCKCGSVIGEIFKDKELVGLRFICMCKDCQKYAHHLEKSNVVLDQNGGMEVVPVFPKRFKFTKGFENIRGLKLSPETGTFRWYSSCCQSPIANSLTSKAGYIGLITQRLSLADRESLGPVCVRANAASGIKPLPSDAAQGFPIKWFFITLRQILKMYFKKLKRPNPFFDDRNRPLANVDVLDS